MAKQLNPIASGISKATQDELKAQFDRSRELATQQDKNAPQKTVGDYLNEARVQVNDLLKISSDMRNSLATVGDFAPFFDINYLKQEGVTDIAKIDQEYMLTIGRQLLADYRKFDADSKTLNARIGDIKTQLDSIVISNDGSANEVITDIVTSATLVQSDYVTWGEQFQSLIMSSMADIVNHLNPLRPADRRINL